MKIKTMAGAMAGAMLAISGCSAAEKVTVEPEKVMVVYYSWGGNTRHAAEQIHRETGGTLFEIRPKTPYPDNSRYSALEKQAKKECEEQFKPELAQLPKNLKDYDVIFVGTPNWWYTMAPPVRTFLSSGDLSGKTVILFVTHGGGGMANCERDARKVCPGAKFLPGAAFSGRRIRQSDAELAEFVHDRIILKK